MSDGQLSDGQVSDPAALSDAERERILAEKSLERLERWHEKAVVAASVGEVIEDPS